MIAVRGSVASIHQYGLVNVDIELLRLQVPCTKYQLISYTYLVCFICHLMYVTSYLVVVYLPWEHQFSLFQVFQLWFYVETSPSVTLIRT